MLHEMGLMYIIPTPTTSYQFFWTLGAKFGARCHNRMAPPCTTGASHMRSQCGHRERQKWSNKRPRRRAVPKLGNTLGAQVQSSSKTQLSSKLNANPTWPIHASSNWPKAGERDLILSKWGKLHQLPELWTPTQGDKLLQRKMLNGKLVEEQHSNGGKAIGRSRNENLHILGSTGHGFASIIEWKLISDSS